MPGLEAAMTSGAGHLLSFTGTDTIPAIPFLEFFYGADVTKELVGGSVPATEHSVMCAGGKDNELQTIERLLRIYKTGILSVVSDTWNLWDLITKLLPQVKEQIMGRDGKLVIRPDSGDPVKIICGDPDGKTEEERKGVVELLWDIFGGAVNEKGFKVLDSHIGAIYGDSITLARAKAICEGLMAKGFAAQVVFGIGSYTYCYNTRDTLGLAMKATYVQIAGEKLAIFKDPITDDGLKKSNVGLMQVYKDVNGEYAVKDNCTPEEEAGGELQVIFENGKLVKFQTLAEIRARLASYLPA